MSLDRMTARRRDIADYLPAAARPERWRRTLTCSGIYLALWLATWYAQRLLESTGSVSLCFLPAGLRFFCLLVLGWPGVLLELMTQCLFALLQIGPQAGKPVTGLLSSAMAWHSFSTLGALAANALIALPLRRAIGDSWDFRRPTQSIVFAAAALAASALAALTGAFGLNGLQLIEPGQFSAAVFSSMIGDFIAIITLTPLLLMRAWPALRHYLQSGRWSRRRQARPTRTSPDRQTLLIVLPVLLLLAIAWHLEMTRNFPLLALLLLLPLATVALHCGQRATLLAVPLLDGGLVLLIAWFDPHQQALHYQLLMIAMALLGLGFGGAVARLRRTEAAQRSSQRSLRATFEQAAVGIAMVAPDGCFLRANGKLCQIVGYALDDLLGMTFQDITHPHDLIIDLDEVRKVLAGEQPAYALEKRYRRKDGSFVWINLTVVLVRRSDGSAEYFIAVIEDIQSRKEANLALQVSQAALKEAQHLAGVGNWHWDRRSGEQIWSPEVYRIFGRDPALPPLADADLAGCFTPASWASLAAAVEACLTQGTPYACDAEIVRADGTRCWISARGQAERSSDGELVGLNGTLQDITPLKHSAEALHELNIGLEQRDVQRTAELNAALAQSFAMRQRLQDYHRHLAEGVFERTDKLAVTGTEQRRLNRALRLLSDANIVLFRATDEQQLLDELCHLVVDSGGYLMGWVGFAQHDAGKSVCVVAQSGYDLNFPDTLRVSWDGAQHIGCGPMGTAIRTATTQTSQDCQTCENLRPWRELTTAHGVQSIIALPITVENRVVGAFALCSGTPRAFNALEIGLLEELSGNLSCGLQTLRARRQIEADQQHLEEQVAQGTREIASLNVDLAEKATDAQAANRAKSAFLSTMSHEIRTPLNAVVGLSGLLADSALTRSQRDYADKIQLAAQTLAVIVDDILDFSRIEAGALRLEPAPFSLDAVLRTTAAVLSVGTRGKPIEALFDVMPGIPDRLIGDAMRVQQILINLVGNAVKFTEAGEIAVSVRCLAQSASQVTLQFGVRDSGIGIAHDQLQLILEAFVQAPSPTHRLYGGRGLGLTISARLAALMGSRIEISSVEGSGSEIGFAVTLERSVNADPVVAPETLPGLRVLIVDDHPLTRTVLSRACANFGWRAIAVDDAAAGLDELRRSAAHGDDYDLLLVDWRMPGIDGIEMLRQANATADISLPLVVLMVPTFELEQAVAASDDLYIDSLLSKPMTPLGLLEAAQRAHSGDALDSLPPPGPPNRQLAGMHLLVAEDNDLNQLVIEQMLTRAGAEIVLVADGLAAVEALRSPTAHFDAVLMDLQMPVMDGHTAARLIRDELGRRDLPIIAVSAYARPEDLEESRRSGMTGHLVKPIAVDDLLDIVCREAHTNQGQPQDGRTPTLAAATIELPGVDVTAALQAFGDDQQKYGSILRQFVVGHADDIGQARRLFGNGDRKGAASLVHDLCGMASMVRAMEMAHLASATEGAIGRDDAVPLLFDELEAATNTLTGSIEQIDAMAAG